MTYYEILEVDSKATANEIKKQYKKLVKKYHPDTNPDVDSKYIVKINEAYEILSNVEYRAIYDLSNINYIPHEKSSDYIPYTDNSFVGKVNYNDINYLDPHVKINLDISYKDFYTKYKKYKIPYTKKTICECVLYNIKDNYDCPKCNNVGWIESSTYTVIELPLNAVLNSTIVYKELGNVYKHNNNYAKGHLIVKIINIDLPYDFTYDGQFNIVYNEEIEVDSLDSLVGGILNLPLPDGRTHKYEYKSVDLFNLPSNFLVLPNKGIPITENHNTMLCYKLKFARPNKNTMARIRYMIRNNSYSDIQLEEEDD